MNQPKRDTALLGEAGVTLDRALFPLLVGIEKKGPIGIVELAEKVGRDHTTVSRQVAKLEKLRLIYRKNSSSDNRIKQALLTAKGQKLTGKISVARETKAMRALSNWTERDLNDLTRLMTRFANDLKYKK